MGATARGAVITTDVAEVGAPNETRHSEAGGSSDQLAPPKQHVDETDNGTARQAMDVDAATTAAAGMSEPEQGHPYLSELARRDEPEVIDNNDIFDLGRKKQTESSVLCVYTSMPTKSIPISGIHGHA